jgi:hypothetical protein
MKPPAVALVPPGHLPLTGAEPAQRHVPGTAACKAAALAKMFEARRLGVWFVG